MLQNRALGQAWPGTTNLQPAGASGTKCYRCGNQGDRLMTPSMAALVPGGCTEVAPSFCGTGTTTPTTGTSPTTGSWGSPTGISSSFMDGPTEITVIVKEPTELKVYTGGADVVIYGYNVRNFNQTTGAPVLTEVTRGKTDQNGKFIWRGQAPTSPNTEYKYQVWISLPGGPVKKVDVPARAPAAASAANGMLSQSQVVVAVCPPNVDSLICAVAEAQIYWVQSVNQQLLAWNFDAAGANQARIASFAAGVATGEVGLGHPALIAHWETFRWWIGDLEIQPKDWPGLVKNYNQTWNIFVKIPFPKWPGIEKLFQTCARAIPIGQGKHNELYSAASARLYVKKFSDYFPREDKQIAKDMAAAYMLGLQPILLCMQHRIERKIEETKRTMKTMAIISYCTVLINLPFLMAAGAGGFAAFATETWDFIKMTTGNQPLGLGVSSAIAAAALAAGDTNLVVGALEPIVKDILKDVDPMAAKAITMIYPQIVKLAVSAVGSIAGTSAAAGTNTIVAGASSFIDMSTIASAIAVMAVKAVAAIPKMYAAQKVESLGDALAGAQDAAKDVLNFVAGEEVSDVFKPFLLWVVEAMGILDLVDQAIDDFLSQFQQALETGQGQGGSITVVPEDGGGGPAIVPTDSTGTPTDVHGTPLPGGTAPETPPSGGSTIPGVTPNPMPGMPTTTATQGMEPVNPLGAVVGVGGATVALLLVTGAVS